MKIDYKNFDIEKIGWVDVEGMEAEDAPRFCDAYVCGASYSGVELTPDELEALFEEFPTLEGKLIFDYTI